jgi:TolA-binding protein
MSLDGLRAWIGEVERKLGMRTRVFLALSVLAIAGAGAAIYLAVDAHNKTVSESDLQSLQQQLEGQMGSSGGSTTAVTQLEAEVRELKEKVEGLTGEEGGSTPEKGSSEKGSSEGGTSGGGNGAGLGTGAGSGTGSSGAKGKEASTGSPESTSPTPTTGTGPAAAKLKELIEQAKGK